MDQYTYLGDNIVKELENEPTSGLVGDGDVKVGDRVGHLDVLLPTEYKDVYYEEEEESDGKRESIYVCSSGRHERSIFERVRERWRWRLGKNEWSWGT